MRLYLDIDTGQVSYTLGGPVVSTFVIYLRDKLPVELVYVQAGEIVTDEIVDGGTNILQRIGLKSVPSGTLLAGASSYTVETAGSGESAFDYSAALLSLNTTALIDYFAANVAPGARDATMLFEVETSAIDFTSRVTRLQISITVRRDVLQPTDEDPISADEAAGRAETAAANAALAAVAAAASAESASDDATATAADRVQTGLDRVATGADVTATAADRVQTGLDRTATGADATATAADRVQTGLDRTATGADATATAADRVQTGLDRTATGADATATAADRVQTGLDRVATAADRVQTGSDRSAASSSAASAAASAAAAINAILLQYKGAIAASAVPATSTAAGDYYRISTGGNAANVTAPVNNPSLTVGDWIAYNGTSGNWTRIPAGAVDEARILRGDSSRRVAGYVQSDGATSNRAAGIYGPFDATLNPRGWLAGVAALTPLIRVTVPTASSTAEIWGASSSSTALASATAWSIGLAWSGNDLVLRCNGATPATDYRTVTWTGLRTTWSGQEITLEPSIVAGTGTPTLKVNGVLTAGTAADGAGTDPDWLSTSLVSTWHVVGYNWPIGVAPRVVPILGIITDAESDAWRLRGVLPFWVVSGGHAANLITNGGFETNTNGWAIFAGGAISRITSDFYVGAACLQVIASSSGDGVRTDSSGGPVAQPTAKRYSTRFAAKSVSGNTTLRIARGNGSQQVQVTLTSSWQVFDVAVNGTESPSTATNLLAFYLAGAGTFLLDDISARQDGASTVPVVQPCLVIGDASHIGDNQGRLLGCLPVTDEQRWRIVARTHTSAVQDVQAFGGPIFMEANRSRIDSCAAIQNSGGALNIQIGSTSGGSDLVASTSIASGSTPTELTLTLRYPPTQNLWVRRVAGAGTAPFTVTLEGHRIGSNP